MSLLHQLLVSIRSKMKGEETKEMDEQQQSHFDDDTGAAAMEGGGTGRGSEPQPPPSPSRPLSPVARYSLHSHNYAYQLEDERTGADGISAGAADERRDEEAWRLGKSERRSPPLRPPPQPHGEYKQRRSVSQSAASAHIMQVLEYNDLHADWPVCLRVCPRPSC